MVEPRDTIKIVNVVASTGIGIEINLKQATLALEGADYDPERFPGLCLSDQGPEDHRVNFSIGKNCLNGCKEHR